jgi:hypothetical protein
MLLKGLVDPSPVGRTSLTGRGLLGTPTQSRLPSGWVGVAFPVPYGHGVKRTQSPVEFSMIREALGFHC